MSWMNRLFRTFNNYAGQGSQGVVQLMPVAHMKANAQIEITLNQEGEIKGAALLSKDQTATLIPVTEDSAGRTSGLAPHALCDMLPFVAGDFYVHCENEKQKKSAREKHQAYITNLEKWVKSKDSHPKIQAVYKYLSRKNVTSDLAENGLIELKKDGTFENKKILGQTYDKVMVRFRILSAGSEPDGTWEDESLITAYLNYYLENRPGKMDVCYFTGRKDTVSGNHPKGILPSDYGAKLVSANDAQGYTYRGRFQDAEQAYALSYDASQKMHSALTWLVEMQGAAIGSKDKRIFICWNPQGKEIPEIFDELGLAEDDEMQSTVESYQKNLRKTFQGYMNQFTEADSIIVMGMDAATTGRLSITYYNELAASDFFERVIFWGASCSWYFLKFNQKRQPYYAVETPIFRRIVACAFGHENGNYMEADDKVLKEQIQRLVKCMLENQRMPYDIVHALFIRASMPTAYTRGNRERVLSTACALIRKYYYKKTEGGKEVNDMKLDTENNDRSYLFGRLLAIYETVERSTYDREETREPNAIRLQSAYVHHPMQILMTLDGLLIPYLQKMNPKLREYYKKMISNIMVTLRDQDEKILNQELKETYLLGYYLQRAELYRKKENETEVLANGQFTKQN